MGFNPPLGILAVQAQTQAVVTRHAPRMFQSPTRDSGRSSRIDLAPPSARRAVSIPHSGFWPFKPFSTSSTLVSSSAFQSPTRDSGRSSATPSTTAHLVTVVSIPHSGFWPFKPRRRARSHSRPGRFNPPLGILAVQACWGPLRTRWGCRGFNPPLGILAVQAMSSCSSFQPLQKMVSIPHSGFWPFKLGIPATMLEDAAVSIPHSGFWPFKPELRPKQRKFVEEVSIPHSGFWPFKRERKTGSAHTFAGVSIPHSGFWPFKPCARDCSPAPAPGFQSPTRDSGRSSGQALGVPW